MQYASLQNYVVAQCEVSWWRPTLLLILYVCTLYAKYTHPHPTRANSHSERDNFSIASNAKN